MTDKVLVGKAVADKLHATELSIDQALCDAAKLMNEMVSARMELKLGAVVGDGAVAQLAEATRALSQARQAVVLAHTELDVVRKKLGIRTAYYGDWLDKEAALSSQVTSVRERAS